MVYFLPDLKEVDKPYKIKYLETFKLFLSFTEKSVS